MTAFPAVPTTDAWLNPQPVSGTPAPSLSERLIHALEAHASAEAHDLAMCEELASQSSDAVLKLLLGLITEDGRRHQAVVQGMVRRLQEEVEFVASPTALPVGPPDPVEDAKLSTGLRNLIRDQHEGARYLRHVARWEPHLYDGLYPVLFEAIARDSEKHAMILRYLLLRFEDRLR